LYRDGALRHPPGLHLGPGLCPIWLYGYTSTERRCCFMSQEHPIPLTPAMEKAVNELKGTIAERFPQASFVVEEGFDPKGIYLVTTVDIADTDEVMDVIGDRLVALQVDEGLPIYVTPLRPIRRVIAELRELEQATSPSRLPLP